MNSKTENYTLDRQAIYDMLTKEDNYAQAWSKGKEANTDAFPAHAVSRRTGEPFSESEFLDFAQKYLDEARLAIANYCPDLRAVRIRMLKGASLLVTALQVHGEKGDIDAIAGVSSNKYPILHGGLQVFQAAGPRAVDAV